MKYELIKEQYTENIINGSVQNLGMNAEKIKDIFVESVMGNTMDETWKAFSDEPRKFEAITNLLGIIDSNDKQRVYYFAVMKTIIELSKAINDKLKDKVEEKEFYRYKYLFPVLEVLAKNNIQSQGKIAEKLSVSKNTLSNFFRRTNQYDLWNIEKVGKNQYYAITLKGKNVYKTYNSRSIVEDEKKLDLCLIVLIDAISDELESRDPNIERIIRKVNNELNLGVSNLSSEILKLKLRMLFSKAEMGNRKRRDYKEILNRKYDQRCEHHNTFLQLYYDNTDDLDRSINDNLYIYDTVFREEVYH